MALKALKRAWKNVFLPIQSFDNLPVGTYAVTRFRLKETKFGQRVFVEIDDFCVVLPPRFSENIYSQAQIVELNKNKMKMIFKGKYEEKNNLVCVKFKRLNERSDSSEEEEDLPTKKKKKNTDRTESLIPVSNDEESTEVDDDVEGIESTEEEEIASLLQPSRKKKIAKRPQRKLPRTFV